ncbi:cyclophilin-like domain-containing protein [Radiomyces spectabilis]|uniref:cyclophilin-like domain-containing protein n=1 Tax=Radiomyces spectabilis TaxID=64574 RepID=UPI00221EA98C|nr:cyclophilin-like domain-containing protein [Radiomyces spectabilis]KAI8374288.1 cyclophilin-like domain-containing protein [Radiomyces spectabilis]
MSNIYVLEPPTNAKVILHTTAGDVEIELWGKETPLAARNFIQLCMEGYYDNTIFHRIVPNFIIQGGDPTGTGQGGESIYEEEFPDEFHSRLRFIRRGLVGMANTGENDNGSQFFITLDRADELTKKHTLFGRVAGDTIFNVLKMGEMEIDDNERPLYPPRIKSTEIVLNPFDDIVPRINKREQMVAKAREEAKEAQMRTKTKKKVKKQLNLLSFGEEAADMEEALPSKMKSSHDITGDTPVAPSPPIQEKSKRKMVPVETTRPDPQEDRPSPPVTKSSPPPAPIPASEPARKKKEKSEPVREEPKTSRDKAEQLMQDIRAMEQDRRDEIMGVKKEGKPEKKKKISLIEQEREKYMQGKAIVGGLKARKRAAKAEDDTFAKLMAFQRKLTTSQPSEPVNDNKDQKPPCALHGIPNCESCYDTSMENDDKVTDEGWMSHKLVFEKDLKGKDLMQRRENVDDYVVIDPRDREAQAKQEEYERKRSKKSHLGEAFQKRPRDSSRSHHEDDRRARYDDDYKRSRTHRDHYSRR